MRRGRVAPTDDSKGVAWLAHPVGGRVCEPAIPITLGCVCQHTADDGRRSRTTSPPKCPLKKEISSPLPPACPCADKLLAPIAAKRVHIYQSPVTGTYDAVNSIWRGSLGGEGSAG